MVAFITSIIIGILGLWAVIAFGKRRKVGEPMTWGEAMVAAVYTFFMMLWWYAIIPHQWLTLADGTYKWSKAKILYGPFDLLQPRPLGGSYNPITISYQEVRDLIAVLIYALALGLQIWIWSWWNKRDKKAKAKAADLPTSSYGRPLVKRG